MVISSSTANRILQTAVLAATLMTAGHAAVADEVTDTIKEATAAYEKGDRGAAIESLNYAVQLIQQMKGDSLAALLPEPLEGWTAGDAESTAMGTAMFGGGVSAERSYSRDDQSVTIQIVADSPMLQAMMMMFSNPMYASSSGGKLERIAGQKVISTYDAAGKSGDYKIMVANRYLVTITGEGVGKDEMKAYTEAIDYKKLEE